MNAAGRYVRSWHFSDVTAALRMSAVEGRTEVRIAGPDFRFLTHKRHPPDLVVPRLPAPRNFEFQTVDGSFPNLTLQPDAGLRSSILEEGTPVCAPGQLRSPASSDETHPRMILDSSCSGLCNSGCTRALRDAAAYQSDRVRYLAPRPATRWQAAPRGLRHRGCHHSFPCHRADC